MNNINKFNEIKNSIDTLNNNFKLEFFYQSLFNVVSKLSEENSVSIYTIIENLIYSLSKESKEKALTDLFKSITLLLDKENVDLFKLLEKFFKLLNENNQNILIEKMNSIIKNINNSITKIANSNLEFPVPPVSVKIKESTITSLKTPIPPPPPPPNTLKNNDKNVNSLEIKAPLPSQINRTLSLSEHLKTTNNKIFDNQNLNSGIKELECIYPDEIIKYLIPSIADNGRKALSSFATPLDIYQFLKKVDGTKTLEELFNELYKVKDILSYINRIYNMVTVRHINLTKSTSFPANKRLYIKIGEVLVFMKIIDKERLEKVIKLHEIAKKTSRFEKRNLTKTLAELRLNNFKVDENQILFGEFLVNSDIIKTEKLEEALKFQSKYNSIVENIK